VIVGIAAAVLLLPPVTILGLENGMLAGLSVAIGLLVVAITTLLLRRMEPREPTSR
jgi:hypothetical protein